ncbi:MAG: DNA/RNA non-specific endonuclease [Gemmatimonadaceae bacterium]
MRIHTWSAALVALTLVAPACSERDLIGPKVPLTRSFTVVDVDRPPEVRISEIHYDNTGTDTGEFIEVSGPAHTDLTGWKIVLYNGANGTQYDSDAFTGLIPDLCDGRGVMVLNYGVDGIQNGSPDGMALVDASNNVVEFLSYEGAFVAVASAANPNTPAAGRRSTDIAVTEAGTTPIGQSLARSGLGANLWSGPAANTKGTCNDNQEPPPPPPPIVIPATRFSEIHYDNIGPDGNETIEISGPAGTDLSGWSIVLYNGSGGLPYDTKSLSGTIPAMCEGRGVVVVSYPQDGIQNGPNDGFALVNAGGQVVEFLSYEGAVTATSGPALGVTSTDIGESEVPSSALPLIGYSLQRNSDGIGWRQTPDGLAARPATFGLCNGSTAPPLRGVVTFTGRSAFDDPPLPVGFEDQLFGTERDPSSANVETSFTWTSETPTIASIDQDGVMRALAPGTAILRATATDGTTGLYALPTRIALASTTAVYEGNAEFGEPTDADASDDFIVRRAQLTSSYNVTKGTPNWVAYEMEASHFGDEDRCDCFTFDPALPSTFAPYTTADYTGASAINGFAIDRGHLARSSDRDAGSLDNAITYYFTNIVPQAADNNQGPWSKLEVYLGDLAKLQGKEVYVIAGVAGSRGTLKNEGKITIPEYVWKVAVIMPHNQGIENIHDLGDVELEAVIMPNVAGIRNDDWQKYRATVNQVEALSGYDLLALLNDEIETAVESGLQDAYLQVRHLVADRKINKGVGNSLESKLDAAAKQLDRGNNVPAVNQLEAVLAEVSALVDSGRLEDEDVSALRAVVEDVMRSVSS